MPGLQERGEMTQPIPPSMLGGEKGRKGKVGIKFPDGTTGSFNSMEEAMEAMQEFRANQN